MALTYDTLYHIAMENFNPGDIIKVCDNIPIFSELCIDPTFWRTIFRRDFSERPKENYQQAYRDAHERISRRRSFKEKAREAIIFDYEKVFSVAIQNITDIGDLNELIDDGMYRMLEKDIYYLIGKIGDENFTDYWIDKHLDKARGLGKSSFESYFANMRNVRPPIHGLIQSRPVILSGLLPGVIPPGRRSTISSKSMMDRF